MEKFLFENDVDGMRARDLRNLLVQKLGVDPNLISRIIDRNELKEMVAAIFHEKIQQKAQAEFTHNMFIATAVVGVLTVLFIFRKAIFSFFATLYGMLGENSYKSAKKAQLMMFNARKGEYLGALALGVSLLLEIAVMQMQISTLLSWVVAPDHPVRRFMLPMFSFPVNANTLVKATTGGKGSLPPSSEGGLGATISNFSLDVGPMITIAALNFLVGKLDEYAAGIVLDHVKAREDKKATKKFTKAFGAKKAQRTANGSGTNNTDQAADGDQQFSASREEDILGQHHEEDEVVETATTAPRQFQPSTKSRYSAATLRAMAMNSPYASTGNVGGITQMGVAVKDTLQFDANLESYMEDESDWLGQGDGGEGEGFAVDSPEGQNSTAETAAVGYDGDSSSDILRELEQRSHKQKYGSEWLD